MAELRRLLGTPDAADEVEILSGGRLDIETIRRLASVVYVPRSGRPPDIERSVIAESLKQIVEAVTGAKSKYTYDVDTEEHTGPRFLLMRAFMDAEGRAQSRAIAPLNATIAKIIQRADPKKRRKTNLPRK